jgi:hypothetical protein
MINKLQFNISWFSQSYTYFQDLSTKMLNKLHIYITINENSLEKLHITRLLQYLHTTMSNVI